MWALFTVVASDIVQGDMRSDCLVAQLQSVLISLDIRGKTEFAAELARWPWIQDWHPVHVRKVWAALANHSGDSELQVGGAQAVRPSLHQSTAQARLFLGGLEFYGGN